MSAYVVDRHHIVYLMKAAKHVGAYDMLHQDGADPTAGRLRRAQALWDECVKSVRHRYPGDEELPGPIGEDYQIRGEDFHMNWGHFDLLQIINACKCWEYQSCEHPEEQRNAEPWALVEKIKTYALSRFMCGQEQLVWGAPEPSNGRCSCGPAHPWALLVGQRADRRKQRYAEQY